MRANLTSSLISIQLEQNASHVNKAVFGTKKMWERVECLEYSFLATY